MRQKAKHHPNLVLVGFMGTGKSTIGRKVAQELGFRFRDSDSLIEARCGKSIPQIFAEQGEVAFREMEEQVIQELARDHQSVISTGGGAPLNALNVARLRRRGVVILLSADPREILARTERRRNRPLLANAEDPLGRIERLLADRASAYSGAAQRTVETTGLSLGQSVERVLAAYRELAGVGVSEKNLEAN